MLERGSERPLALVCAPAGYGKTTIVAQWLRAESRTHAWLSVDDSDNDPTWFAARLLAALERALPRRFEGAWRALQAGAELETTLVPLLANALAAEGAARPVVVLDDYHLIEDGDCHRFLARLVDSVPATSCVVVSTRSEPPLRLPRRRAAGTVAELGPAALRFDRREAERLLNGRLGLGLSASELDLIDERLDGWPAGLALLASAIAERRDRAGVLEALERSRGDLDAYLTEEVIDAAAPEQAEFLLATSILDRLCAPLCEAVLEDPTAGARLDELRRMNLFLNDLDPQGEWLRYHHMFAATLRAELNRRRPGLAVELHRRASTWFERAGLPEEAIEHALRAADGPRAAALLAARWQQLLAARRHVTIRRVLERLPEERGEFGPLCEALDLLCLIYEGVDQRLTAARASALAARLGDEAAARLVLDGILISPFYGEVAKAARLGDEALERYAGVPGAEAQIGAQAALVRWFAGDYDRVRQLLEPRLLLEQPPFLAVWTPAILAMTATEEQDAELAERYARQAAAAVRAVDGETATEFAGVPWVLAEALRLAGKLAEARQQMARGLENEERRPGSVGHAVALLYDGRLALAEGDHDAARRSARRAREIVARFPDLGVIPDRLADLEAALRSPARAALLGSAPTPAELRVLTMLGSERTLSEIAAELYLSRETVKSHTQRLYRRLGVGTRKEAVAAARRRGLLGGDAGEL